MPSHTTVSSKKAVHIPVASTTQLDAPSLLNASRSPPQSRHCKVVLPVKPHNSMRRAAAREPLGFPCPWFTIFFMAASRSWNFFQASFSCRCPLSCVFLSSTSLRNPSLPVLQTMWGFGRLRHLLSTFKLEAFCGHQSAALPSEARPLQTWHQRSAQLEKGSPSCVNGFAQVVSDNEAAAVKLLRAF